MSAHVSDMLYSPVALPFASWYMFLPNTFVLHRGALETMSAHAKDSIVHI